MKRDQIQSDIIKHMKAQDKESLTAARSLMSNIKYLEIDLGRSMTDEEIEKLVADTITSLSESVAKFRQSGREDLCKEYEFQIGILQSYLPAQVDDATLKELVSEIIKQNQDLLASRKGQIIGIANQTLKTKASVERIVAQVKAQIGL